MNDKLVLSILISIVIATAMLTFAMHNLTPIGCIGLIVAICAISYIVYDIL